MNHYTILCVDDEEHILSALKRVFLEEEHYEIITTTSGEKGLEILQKKPVDLIISDQRMPGMNGVEFLKEARKLYPDTIRIVLSGFSDLDTITKAINEGEIYRLIQKPWEDEELLLTVKDSLEKYRLMKENRTLQEEIRKQNEELKALNMQLEEKVRERTQELLLRNQILLLSQEMLHNISTPIMGISSDETVVFINKNAQELFKGNGSALIGKDIKEVFSQEIVARVRKVLENHQAQTIPNIIYNHQRLTLNLLPLSGPFAGKGVILEGIKKEGK